MCTDLRGDAVRTCTVKKGVHKKILPTHNLDNGTNDRLSWSAIKSAISLSIIQFLPFNDVDYYSRYLLKIKFKLVKHFLVWKTFSILKKKGRILEIVQINGYIDYRSTA